MVLIRVIRYIEVNVTVAVVVAPDDSKSPAPWLVNARCLGNFRICSIAIASIEDIRLAYIFLRHAIRVHSLILADFVFIQLVLKIVGHIEIQMTIIIIVCKGARSSPPSICNIGSVRYIGERSILIVTVEAVFSKLVT